MPTRFSGIANNIFSDISVLQENYQPSVIHNRDEEMDAFAHALLPVLENNRAKDIIAYGKTGVGKTVVTNHMTDELLTENDTRGNPVSIKVIKHNCNGDSVFDVVRSLINKFRGPNQKQFPRRGLSTSHAFETLYSEIDAFGGNVIVVLDEVDHVADANTLLYEITRARAADHITEAQISIVGISNDLDFRNTLSPKVRSTLQEREVKFTPYDAPELQTILANRADVALYESAYDASVITLVSALAAKDAGSARQAIDLLREAGERANEDGRNSITEEDVYAAKERVERGKIKDDISTLTDHGKYVLAAVAYLELTDSTPARSKEIFTAYQSLTDPIDCTQLTTLKSIQNHLSELDMLGFLIRHDRNDGRSGGSYAEYECDFAVDSITDVLSEQLDLNFRTD